MTLDLIFSANATQFEVEIPIINDTLTEFDEMFQVDLRTSNSDVNLSPASGFVTIQDDDGRFSWVLHLFAVDFLIARMVCLFAIAS